MKKLLVLFVAVVATISTFAATQMIYFNRAQFQWSSAPHFVDLYPEYDAQLTVPFVYKGTINFASDYVVEPALETLTMAQRERANCLISNKAKSIPAIMTICQPCIDCYPCDVLDLTDAPYAVHAAADKAGEVYTGIVGANEYGQPGWITVWNLYIIRVDKKAKEVEVDVIDLLADENQGIFFTGAKGKNVYIKAVSEEGNAQLQLTGAKSDYKFKYYENYLLTDGAGWLPIGEVTKGNTAYIKSAKSLNGSIYYNYLEGFGNDTTADQVEILDVAGTVKLTRDSSLTGKAIKGAFGSEVQKVAKNWDDCIEITEAANCEEYFGLVFEDEYFGSTYKKYDVEFVAYTADEFFAEIYGIEEEEEEEEEEEI